MAISFYYLSGSPFSWKVWLSLEHKQIPYELRVLSADTGDLKGPEFLAINPRGKVPAIVDEGFALYESSAIAEYLDEKFGGSAPLWPADLRARALARRIAAEGDAYVYPPVRKLMLELIMRREGEPDDAAVSGACSTLLRELALFEGAISGPFVAGVAPSAADFTLYPFLAVLNRVHSRRPEYAIGEVVPMGVRKWMAEVEALPYFAKTIPPHWRTS